LRKSGSGLGRRRFPETNRFRGLPVAGFAVAGLLLGHALSYAIAVPDPYHRDLLLQRTGHDYLPAFGQVALMLFVGAIAAVVFGASRRRAESAPDRFAPLAARLALVQVGAFGVQEVAERLLSGSGLHDLGHGHVVIVGVTAQIAVALAGAALLRWLVRASDRLGEILGSAFSLPRPVPAFALPLLAELASGRVEVRPPGQRAPPSA
jgi:hypothetical protein